MAITASDIQFFKSDGTDSTGGAISGTQITDNTLNNLFDDVNGDEANAGMVDYRKIFIKNNHGSLTWQDVKMWIQSQTNSDDDAIDISETTDVTGSDPTGAGQSYVRPTSKVHADVLTLGNIAAGASVPVWIRRTVDAAASAFDNDTFQLKAEGDTAA